MGNQVFQCPACGTAVAGVASFGQPGLKCPTCGAGFVPPEMQRRERAPAPGPDGVKLAVLLVLVLLIGVVLLFGTGVIGLTVISLTAPSTIIILLLIGIFVRLGRKN